MRKISKADGGILSAMFAVLVVGAYALGLA